MPGQRLELRLALEVPDDHLGVGAARGEVAAALGEGEGVDRAARDIGDVLGSLRDDAEELAGWLKEVRAAVEAAARERAVGG